MQELVLGVIPKIIANFIKTISIRITVDKIFQCGGGTGGYLCQTSNMYILILFIYTECTYSNREPHIY